MRIREYTEADLEALRAMHGAQGFDYEFPDLSNPLFVAKLVLVEAEPHGKCAAAGKQQPAARTRKRGARATAEPVMAVLVRVTSEAYLLMDQRAGAPRERWERFVALERAAAAEAYRRGLDDVHCWLPPAIARRFGRRLERLGWVRDDTWTPYCKRLSLDGGTVAG